MRVGLMAENPLESAILATGIVPAGMLESYSPAYARAITAATRLGLFDALSGGPRSAEAVAQTCQTDPRATEKLLNLLVTMKYVAYRDGSYTLARHTRRWLLADASGSIRDLILMKELEWGWIDHMESFVRHGQPLDVHGAMSTHDWGVYQRAGSGLRPISSGRWSPGGSRSRPARRKCWTSEVHTATSPWSSADGTRASEQPCSICHRRWSMPPRSSSARAW